MALTRIPERYRPGLGKIVSFGTQQVAELADAIQVCSPRSKFSEFSSSVHSRLEAWKREDIYDVLRTLVSLSMNLADSDTTIEDFTSQLVNAMRSSGKEGLGLSEEAEASFSGKIKTLLSINSLKFTAKALGLKQEHQKLFCDVKVISDIRPVFVNAGQRPMGGFIGHMLRIQYHEDEELKQFSVALDGSDIAKFRQVLERAETKAASLKSLIAEVGITDFDRP